MERAKVISGRYFDAWNTADLDLVERTFAPEFVIHDPASPLPLHMGPEGVKGRIIAYRKAIPDLAIDILDRIAEGDKVMTADSRIYRHPWGSRPGRGSGTVCCL